MRAVSTFSITFFTRKSRSNPSKLSIYVRITVKGKRTEISLKRNIAISQWDANKGRGRGSTEKIRVLNAYLDQVYGKLLQCHKQLLEEDRIITSDAIKSRYLGEDENSKTLLELIAYHNSNMVRVLKAGTMKNYYTTEKYLHRFLNTKRKVKDMYLKQVDYKFITDFEHYLRDYKDSKKELSMGNNGVMKHLERFKKIINLAIKLDWMTKNPFDSFQLKYDKYDRAFLTERELALLENTDLKNDRLQRIKDCFVFSCYTGLSYVDVKELTEDNIVKGIDNNNWIYTKREKTGELVKIPILPKAWRILQKYRRVREMEFTTNILPISSNQKPIAI
ncbi:MAG: site-specific integrase [Algibacter sp.]